MTETEENDAIEQLNIDIISALEARMTDDAILSYLCAPYESLSDRTAMQEYYFAVKGQWKKQMKSAKRRAGLWFLLYLGISIAALLGTISSYQSAHGPAGGYYTIYWGGMVFGPILAIANLVNFFRYRSMS